MGELTYLFWARYTRLRCGVSRNIFCVEVLILVGGLGTAVDTARVMLTGGITSGAVEDAARQVFTQKILSLAIHWHLRIDL